MSAQTTLLSEEDGYRLEQAEMPDGKLVEVRVPVLEAPSVVVSKAGLTVWGYDQGIVGMTYGMMGGTTPRRIYSLVEAEDFINKPEGVNDPFQIQHETIGVINYEYLAGWVGGTIGDTALAEGIRSILAQESVYGKAMPFIKSLLQARIAAYKECVAEASPTAEPSADQQTTTSPVAGDSEAVNS